ncbi:MAG: hypothetical protein E5W56_15320, partial [Mesorhizobium sp.]
MRRNVAHVEISHIDALVRGYARIDIDITGGGDSSTTSSFTTEYCLDQEQPQHEKIRFRRDEITDLEAFP